ncbi:MAG: prolipoprotein diacylglyceryl transferase [Bacteroidaceae bacterium]|nr:prolipoprotein diacylglyceryl transferase [Bacteroidaceae bacterium]
MTTLPCSIVWNPSMSPFSIFGFEVRYYSLCWIIGLGLGYYIMRWLYKRKNVSEELFEPLFLYCFLGILIGARLGHCIFYEPQQYLTSLKGVIEMFLPLHFAPDSWDWRFTGYQGLASHGGTIGLFTALFFYARKTKLSFTWVLDNIAITTPVVAGMIRLGNFMNSEILGRATEGPFGIIFAQVDNVPRHPAQLYEAIAYFIIFACGLLLYKRLPQKVGSLFYFGYCLATIFTFRFFIEFLKEVQVDFEKGMMLDMGQWLSIPFVVIGVVCMIRGLRK